jgi:hypothetical protein
MARTNLTSQEVEIHLGSVAGLGAFRIAYHGTYRGGNRNQQEAVCKSFKAKYRLLEDEYFAYDFKVADRAINYAHEWNAFCPHSKEILITRGDVKSIEGSAYMVEPLIRFFTKFTSNNGWIADPPRGSVTAEDVDVMEAFSHFTYHRSGGLSHRPHAHGCMRVHINQHAHSLLACQEAN